MTGCEIVVVFKDDRERTVVHAAKVRHSGYDFGDSFIEEHPEALTLPPLLIKAYFTWRRSNRTIESLQAEIWEFPGEREHVIFAFDGEIPSDSEEAFSMLLEEAEQKHGLCPCSYSDYLWLVRDGVAVEI